MTVISKNDIFVLIATIHILLYIGYVRDIEYHVPGKKPSFSANTNPVQNYGIVIKTTTQGSAFTE